jgi:hypothetical protein
MKLKAIEFHSKFTAGNKLNLKLRARGSHPGAAIDGVVVGERHHFETHALTVAGEFLGRVRAVRKIRVEV